jgi:hypothetical protein
MRAGQSYPFISRRRTTRARPKRDAIASLPEKIMARSILLCSLLLCLSAVSRAGDVHKCVTPTGITYQGVPCAGAELPAGHHRKRNSGSAVAAGERGDQRARAHGA